MRGKKVKLDPATKAWFRTQPPWMVTTLVECEKCGLFYKASLGHKCKKEAEKCSENTI